MTPEEIVHQAVMDALQKEPPTSAQLAAELEAERMRRRTLEQSIAQLVEQNRQSRLKANR